MERLTEPGKCMIPKITDLASFDYARIYARLQEIEDQIDDGEFLTYKHVKEHSLLPAFQHIVFSKILEGTARIFYEKEAETDTRIRIVIRDEKDKELIGAWAQLSDNKLIIERVDYLKGYE